MRAAIFSSPDTVVVKVLPPANIGYCRRNRSRSGQARVRVHGTPVWKRASALIGRLVSCAIIFIAIDKANIVNLLTTGRSYVKDPERKKGDEQCRDRREFQPRRKRAWERQPKKEKERRKEREKENARKGERRR